MRGLLRLNGNTSFWETHSRSNGSPLDIWVGERGVVMMTVAKGPYHVERELARDQCKTYDVRRVGNEETSFSVYAALDCSLDDGTHVWGTATCTWDGPAPGDHR